MPFIPVLPSDRFVPGSLRHAFILGAQFRYHQHLDRVKKSIIDPVPKVPDAGSAGSNKTGSSSVYVPLETAAEDDLVRASKEAEMARLAVASTVTELGGACTNWKIAVRKNNKKGKKSIDSLRCYGDGKATDWALHYGLDAVAQLGTVDKYTEHEARTLCYFWCHRMQFIYDIWLETSSSSFAFNFAQADLDSYAEPPDVTKFVDAGAARPVVKAFAAYVRSINPAV